MLMLMFEERLTSNPARPNRPEPNSEYSYELGLKLKVAVGGLELKLPEIMVRLGLARPYLT